MVLGLLLGLLHKHWLLLQHRRVLAGRCLLLLCRLLPLCRRLLLGPLHVRLSVHIGWWRGQPHPAPGALLAPVTAGLLAGCCWVNNHVGRGCGDACTVGGLWDAAAAGRRLPGRWRLRVLILLLPGRRRLLVLILLLPRMLRLVLVLLLPGCRHLRVLLLLLPGRRCLAALLHSDCEVSLLPQRLLLHSTHLRPAPAAEAAAVVPGCRAVWVHPVFVWGLLLVMRLERLAPRLVVRLQGWSTQRLVCATAAAELDAQAGVGGRAADAADRSAARHGGESA